MSAKPDIHFMGCVIAPLDCSPRAVLIMFPDRTTTKAATVTQAKRYIRETAKDPSRAGRWTIPPPPLCYSCGGKIGVRPIMVEGRVERACIYCVRPETPQPVHVEHKPGRGWESMFETIARPAVKDVQNQTFIPGFEPTPTRASAKRANDRRQGRLWG